MHWLNHVARSCATLTLIAAIGCSDDFKVYPVGGKIKFEGQPMKGGGSISLVPLTNQPGKTAGGVIAADGTYKLTTYNDGDGSIPGEFRVVIFQEVVKEPERTGTGEENLGKPIVTVEPADRIPAIYSDSVNSPLRTKVEAKSSNDLDFELKRKPQ